MKAERNKTIDLSVGEGVLADAAHQGIGFVLAEGATLKQMVEYIFHGLVVCVVLW